MKRYVILFVIMLGCGTSSQQAVKEGADADSLWKERVRAGVCRRPIYATSNWPEFITAKHLATIRIPPFLHQDRYQAASESAKAGGRLRLPRYATGWDNTDSDDFAQFRVGVPDSVNLVYPGPAEPEESICIEQIDGAKATVFASNRGASTTKRGGSSGSQQQATGDSAAPLGPYMVETTMRYPDGVSFLIFGTASTVEQKNQMLASMRTIRRVGNR